MKPFTVFPAVDLRGGLVVRLREGDPDRETVYASDPARIAAQWLEHGAEWLHVVDLDGAFGSKGEANQKAIRAIVAEAVRSGGKVQLGGGLRTLLSIGMAFDLGIERAVVGTMAIEEPEIMHAGIEQFGNERIAVSLDGRRNRIMVRGWKDATGINLLDRAVELAAAGVRWLVFTDISKDGLQGGVNLEETQKLASIEQLKVIASGGINSTSDLDNLVQIGAAGAIVGRALYEGTLDPDVIFSRWTDREIKDSC